MDAGYVIKGLEESIAFFRDRVTGNMYDKWLHASEEALSLLKAQEPVEPIQDMVGDALFWVCGKCGHDISSSDWYCANCGRAVKWDG